MAALKITRSGLWAIALLTAVLWGCVIMERLTVAQARHSARRALEEIRVMQIKRRAIPVSTPLPLNRAAHPAAG